MSDSVRPHGLQPTRLPRPWDSPGKNTGVGCHFLLQCVKAESESDVAQSCLTLSDPWTAAHQAPLSMGLSRQEYWSGVPLPSPAGDFLDPGMECSSPCFGRCGVLATRPPGRSLSYNYCNYFPLFFLACGRRNLSEVGARTGHQYDEG